MSVLTSSCAAWGLCQAFPSTGHQREDQNTQGSPFPMQPDLQLVTELMAWMPTEGFHSMVPSDGFVSKVSC